MLLDGGIEVAAGYHAVNNLFIGLFANTEAAAISAPSLYVINIEEIALFANVFLDIVAFVLALLILNYKYKWFRLAGMGK